MEIILQKQWEDIYKNNYKSISMHKYIICMICKKFIYTDYIFMH